MSDLEVEPTIPEEEATRVLGLPKAEREVLWQKTIEAVEKYLEHTGSLRVSPHLDPAGLRDELSRFDFKAPLPPCEAIDIVARNLSANQVHSPHPAYFGLFNPKPTSVGIAADALVAAFNPQLAAWSHSPFAAEVERHLVRTFGARFGFPLECADGTFCSGGAEANHTAVLTALADHFPKFESEGIVATDKRPVLYLSSESHHSFVKAARACGLGTRSVRTIAVDESLRMDLEALESQLKQDRAAGSAPFLLVGTAGTTGAGIVDPLPALAEFARREGLWFHVDAAWGGASVLVPELRPLLAGCELADSITFDAHKWLSVPMGAGMFLTRHPDILTRTFGTGNTYMPREAAGLDVVDPYSHSMQWSRRFTGLKVFLSLLVAGWPGYEEALRHQVTMGNLLRQRLSQEGWQAVNRTVLPVVCFVDSGREDEPYLQSILARVLATGKAWISGAKVGGRPVLRACITNYDTQPDHIEGLVRVLAEARDAVGQGVS